MSTPSNLPASTLLYVVSKQNTFGGEWMTSRIELLNITFINSRQFYFNTYYKFYGDGTGTVYVGAPEITTRIYINGSTSTNGLATKDLTYSHNLNNGGNRVFGEHSDTVTTTVDIRSISINVVGKCWRGNRKPNDVTTAEMYITIAPTFLDANNLKNIMLHNKLDSSLSLRVSSNYEMTPNGNFRGGVNDGTNSSISTKYLILPTVNIVPFTLYTFKSTSTVPLHVFSYNIPIDNGNYKLNNANSFLLSPFASIGLIYDNTRWNIIYYYQP